MNNSLVQSLSQSDYLQIPGAGRNLTPTAQVSGSDRVAQNFNNKKLSLDIPPRRECYKYQNAMNQDGENLTPTIAPRQTIAISESADETNAAKRLKGIKKYKVKQPCLAQGAIGEVFQVIHRDTQGLYALKRVNKYKATMVGTQNKEYMIEKTLIRLCQIISNNLNEIDTIKFLFQSVFPRIRLLLVVPLAHVPSSVIRLCIHSNQFVTVWWIDNTTIFIYPTNIQQQQLQLTYTHHSLDSIK